MNRSGRPSGYPLGPPQIRTCAIHASGPRRSGSLRGETPMTPPRHQLTSVVLTRSTGARRLPAWIRPAGPARPGSPWLHRVRSARAFPGLTATTAAPTPDPRPAQLLLRRSAVPPAVRLFAPRGHRHCTDRPGEFGFGSRTLIVLVAGIGFPRFLDNPNVSMACSTTRRDGARQASSARPCGLPQRQERRLARGALEAQRHGLLTHCLRASPRPLPGRRKTRFRLVADLCRVGVDATGVARRNFQSFHSFPSIEASRRTDA